jgi:3-oxoacyl-[acyl-carrier-protein] synthase-1
MSDIDKVYIAGIGMLTPVGGNAEMTAAAINAGISAYTHSHFKNQQDIPITLAGVPEQLLSSLRVDIEPGTSYRDQYDRIIKMAVYALQDTLSNPPFSTQPFKPIPLMLAMPESQPEIKSLSSSFLVKTMTELSSMPVDPEQTRSFYTGRTAGLEALQMAHRYLHNSEHDYVIVGGSDSYWDMLILDQLDDAQRLLSPSNVDGFAPGEAAGFLLLTRHPQNALKQNNHIIALHTPGFSEEEGHLSSEAPYLGNGLDQAFKQALQSNNTPISTIYSSMNGERFWAKEYGVATMRNQQHFREDCEIKHPADCYGDIGAATGSVLIGLSAMQLLKQKNMGQHLVYCSADGAQRAAVCVEKIAYP